MNNYKTNLKRTDLEAWELEGKMPLVRNGNGSAAEYIVQCCRMTFVRVTAQVGLSNRHNCRFILNGILYMLSPKANYILCNLNVPKTIDHFV